MNIESRLQKLESIVGSGEKTTLFDLLGIDVLAVRQHRCVDDSQILPAVQADPMLCQLLRKLMGDDNLTADAIAAEVVTWRKEAAAMATDPPDGPQDAPGGPMPPDGPNIDPTSARGREGQNCERPALRHPLSSPSEGQQTDGTNDEEGEGGGFRYRRNRHAI